MMVNNMIKKLLYWFNFCFSQNFCNYSKLNLNHLVFSKKIIFPIQNNFFSRKNLNWHIVFFILLYSFNAVPHETAANQIDDPDSPIHGGIAVKQSDDPDLPIHGGTAWEAYNLGRFSEAERQFLYLIKTAKQKTADQEISSDGENGKKFEKPEDQEIMNLELGLAYTYMKLDNLEPAKTLFEKLIQQGYKLSDCVPAMLDILHRVKRFDAMKPYLLLLETLFEEDRLKEWRYLWVESAWSAYNDGNYAGAQDIFQKMFSADPHDMNLLTGLGYSLYKQENYNEVYNLLQEESVKDTPEIVELKMILYRKMNYNARAWDLAVSLAKSDDTVLKKIAADYFTDAKKFVAASWTLNLEDQCHTNAWAPELDSFTYYQVKDGDEGTSHLEERSIVSRYRQTASLDREWGILLKARHFSVGNGYQTPVAGSFYRSLNGAGPDIKNFDDELLYEPWVNYKKEGPVSIEIALGMSPMGGAVDGTPAFTIAVLQNSWNFEIHRHSVGDSFLSISGLDDPYGGDSWGRITKNGLTMGRTFIFGEDGWISLNGGYDAYRGVNVWKNSSWHLNGAVGKTIARNNGDEFNYGIYCTWMHFEHNSDFYTFGHGGYYSPDLMVAAGPLIRYKTAPCRDYWLDIQLSTGWMFEKTEDSPKYPIHYEVISEFTSDALTDLQGTFQGNEANRMAGSIKIEGWKMLSNKVVAGGFASLNKGSEYTQWRIGIGLEYCFKSRNGFWQQKNIDNRLN